MSAAPQLDLFAEKRDPPSDAFNVFVAPQAGQLEPTGPLPIRASCAYTAELCAASITGVPADRCLALKARDWSDELMDMLGDANKRAEDELQKLRAMHAKILGCTVEELDERMAKEKAEQDAERQATRAARPAHASKSKPTENPIGIGMAALSDRQRSLLSLVKVEDNFAVYTSEDRIDDWDLLKRIMIALGGTWRTKSKKRPGGFAFADDVDAAELVRLALETGEILDPKAADFFPTPDGIADLLVERLDIRTLDKPSSSPFILEPSAGAGAIVKAIQRTREGAHVVCVEALADNVKALRALGVACHEADFLTVNPLDFAPFQAVAMNPPFGARGDIRHVRHAFKFLAPGGRLASVMSAGVEFRDDRLARDFRAFVAENDGTIERLPDGAFLESGTGVRTCLVTVRRVT